MPLLMASCADNVLENNVAADEESIQNSDVQKDKYGNEILTGVVRVKLSEEMVNRISVQTCGGVTTMGVDELDAIAREIGAKRIERTFPDAGRFEARQRKAGLHLWYEVYFDNDVPVTRASRDFNSADGVEIVEPLIAVKLPEYKQTKPLTFDEFAMAHPATRLNTGYPNTFNDPGLGIQWNYHNDGSLPEAVEGADIRAFEAWAISTGSSEVIVSVVDAGVDVTHVDLKDNIWVNEAELNGEPGVDDDNNGRIDDIYGWNFYDNSPNVSAEAHATHVAGTVSAVNNNGIGLAGVAGGNGTPGSGTRIMPTQIFMDDTFGGRESFAAAMVYAANNGAVISQNSWGYTADEIYESDKEAIDYFIKYAGTDETGEIQTGPMKGGIVICAAGNTYAQSLQFPGGYEPCVAVTAMAANFKRAVYATLGEWIDITAPGGDIASYGDGYNGNGEYGIASLYPGDMYVYLEGTSMACPHVSGVAALMVAHYGGIENPGFTPEMLKEKLYASVRNIDIYNRDLTGLMGLGYVDAYKALGGTRNSNPPAEVGEMTIIPDRYKATVEWAVTADTESERATRYDLVVFDGDLDNVDFSNPPAGSRTATVNVKDSNVGDKLNATFTMLRPDTHYNVAIAGVDIDGNRSETSFATFKTIENQCPLPVSDLTGVWKATSVELTWSVTSDPDDTKPRDYILIISQSDLNGLNPDELPNDARTVQRRVGKPIGEKMTYSFKNLEEGKKYYTAIYGIDVNGGRSEVSVTSGYTYESAPIVIKELGDFNIMGTNEVKSIDLSAYFTDTLDDALTYSVEVGNSNLLSASVSSSTLNITAKAYGETTVTVTATNFTGKSSALTFKVICIPPINSDLLIYPNPVKTDMNVLLNIEKSVRASIQVLNGRGIAVFSNSYQATPYQASKFNLSKLPAGIYTVVVTYPDKTIKRSVTKL